MILGLAMGLMAVLIIAILCVPLLRPKTFGGKTPEFDIGVYKDQLKELERDLERGLLTEDQAKQARAEIERRLLAADERRRQGSGFRGGRKATAVLMLAAPLVPAGAVGLYLTLGQPDMPDMPFDARLDVAPSIDAAAMQGMAQVIADMRARTATNPDDVEAWLLMGDNLMGLERFDEAREALTRAYELTNDPYIRAEAAEAEIAASGLDVSTESLAAFEALHEIDPFEPKSRFYIGLAAEQADNPVLALQEWIDLIVLSPRNAPWLPSIQAQIARVGQETETDLSTLRPSDEAMALAEAVRASAIPSPSQEDIDAVEEMSPEDQLAFIESMVQRLADRLEANPDDPEGWMRLARTYQMLGQDDKAAAARKRAESAALGGENQ